jgi:serine/threonine protein kinase
MEGWKRIEKYQFSLKKLIGEGSYASVYLGKCIDDGENVAVKVIDKKIFLNAYNLKNIQS